MDYQEAKQLTERKEGCKCKIFMKNPKPLTSGGHYEGVFKELTKESIVVEIELVPKNLTLEQVDRIIFE